jgi:hypothetical protein
VIISSRRALFADLRTLFIFSMPNAPMPISADKLARILFDEIVLDPAFHKSTIKDLCGDMNPEIAQRELECVMIFVIDFLLMRSPAIQELYGEKAQKVLVAFVARNKEWAHTNSLDEDIYLDSLETRLSAYNAAFDAWYAGKALEKAGGKRPPESFFSLTYAFCGFCGSRITDPVTIVLLNTHLLSLIPHTTELLAAFSVD